MADGDGSGGIWVPERLVLWSQENRWVHWLLMIVGAAIGCAVALTTGGSVKIYVFCGGAIGFCTLPILIFAIGSVVTFGGLLLFLLLVYNVFIVPEGQPWRLPEIPWSNRVPTRIPSDSPLLHHYVDDGLLTAFGTPQIRDSYVRRTVETSLEGFRRAGFRILRCHYGTNEVRGVAASYSFWFGQSPVGHPEYPSAYLAKIPSGIRERSALMTRLPVLKCPPTKGEADELIQTAYDSW